MKILELFFRLNHVEKALLILITVSFLIQACYYLYFYMQIYFRKRQIRKKGEETFPEQPVSVIICAKNEAENLRRFLPAVLNQDYPAFEVIVVNDGSFDETEDVLKVFSEKYPNLYHTYVPEGTKAISHKKLAVTIGIKAAKNDILLFSDADCEPVSKNWIRLMTQQFSSATEFVLGYGGYFNEKGFLNKLITFDTLFIALQYLSFAIKGFPYMGVGRNLAYRKSTFFNGGNFSSHLDLQSGDDDLFVNQHATNRNTKVELSADSITRSVPKRTFKSWRNQKIRHLTTAPRYKTSAKVLLGTENISRLFFYTTCIACIVTLNPTLLIVSGTLFLLRYIFQLAAINTTAKNFGENRFYLSIPLFDILLPVLNFTFMLRNLFSVNNVAWK